MPKSTEERRQEIADALLRTMSREGYTKSSIAKIAAEAELTPGLIHYHFKTKQEILRDLIGRLVQRQTGALSTILHGATTPRERLKRLLDALLQRGETADSEMASAWVVITAEAIRQPEIREDFQEALDALLGIFVEVIGDGVAQGVFELQDGATADAGAAALVALVHGYLSLGVTVAERIPRGTAAPSAWAMACGLLGIRE